MRVAGLLGIALLTSTGVHAKPKGLAPSELAPTHGYVHVDFPKGGGEHIWVRPLEGSKVSKLDQPAPAVPIASAHAFGSWLPAGRYRIAGWGTLEWKDGPEFEVRPGRVTDLGSYIGVNVGGYQFVLLPLQHAEHAGGVEAATARFADVLVDRTPIALDGKTVSPAIAATQAPSGLGLVADLLLAYSRKVNKPSVLEALKNTKEPEAFIRLVRTFSLPLQDEPARLSDGTLLFPADFGQLRKRTPSGEWSNVGMDTLRAIYAVEADDQRLLAGSDDGHVRASSDGGVTWRTLKTLGRMESIMDIDHDDAHWVVTTAESFHDASAPRGGGLVAAARGTPSLRLRVYTGGKSDLSDLSLSKEFVLAPKDLVGWMGARGQLAGGRYYVMAGTSLQRLDVATGQWSMRTPGPRVSAVRVSPDASVLTATWSQGAFSKVHISRDHGETWTQIGRPPYVIHDVQMDTAESGWASRWNMNAFSGTWETYTFVPAKNDWDKAGEAPFNCKMMRVAADLPVLCFTPDAAILALRSGKWEAEFAP